VSRQRFTPLIPHHALVEHVQQRAEHLQSRIADRITAYAGSMNFVYLHVALSSRFVIINQNRADEKRQVMTSQE
jgi:uncharacterized membrane protein